jgi:DNA-binding HxlR family transcriptional regulator
MKSRTEQCPMQTTANVIGGRWKTVLLWHLLERTHRFAELLRAVRGISQKVLVQQLRELEKDELVTRKVYAQVPPRVEYSLTPLGKSLRSVIGAMCRWGKELQRRRGQAAPTGDGVGAK